MNISVQKSSTQTVVTLEGDLTIYSAADVKVQLFENILANSELEINLAQVSELDSAGTQLLILAKREAVQQNCQLRLNAHSTAVLDVFEIYNLASYFGDPLLMPNDSSDVLKKGA